MLILGNDPKELEAKFNEENLLNWGIFFSFMHLALRIGASVRSFVGVVYKFNELLICGKRFCFSPPSSIFMKPT